MDSSCSFSAACGDDGRGAPVSAAQARSAAARAFSASVNCGSGFSPLALFTRRGGDQRNSRKPALLPVESLKPFTSLSPGDRYELHAKKPSQKTFAYAVSAEWFVIFSVNGVTGHS